MKSTKLTVLILMAALLPFMSCKSKTPETASAAINRSDVALEVSKGKYAIKSGIVEYKTQMMGMDMKQILSFDDYGKKEVTEVMMEMMGITIHSIALYKDGFVYNIDMVKKTGTKSPFNQAVSSNIDFENMSSEMIKDMNLKKIGTETFLGKSCDKMSIDYKKMQMKGDFLVYKGVALRANTDIGTVKMELIGEKFVENPTIPSEKFEVPAGVKITEIK